ncbi:RabGAP/TBC domain-containing protein isoform 2 [Tripterygium wilfordii]|uniref:TBC1 domain family member 15 n=1 Tax=Tripterygium wilfordii TaxID=458696 RepID=A0A7J7BVB8_TRIWF|nr:TBC1 domain family member 17-like isoform X2 [Tripterygium wilfordii]KAF5725840.1 RabGAP/TBC domain-containing protein isoform 2 [Tripterygium wilfordii]
MQEAELHDLSDDADYAASQLHGSASMMRCDSGKQSTSSEPDGAEVVYTKDNVTIHPTQFASERISGRLKLIKQGSSLFMTWIPYKGQNSNAKLSEKDRNLYTIKALPFTDMRSIRRHNPAFGWQYIIVVLASGLAFPPLYFYNGGVKEFLAAIKQHVFLVRSAEDANIFLVNDFQSPLQRTLSSFELPRAVSVTTGQSAVTPVGESLSHENREKGGGGSHDEGASFSRYNGRQRRRNHDPARDISINVLEKFSLVTKFARETTSQLFGDSPSNGFSSLERRTHNNTPIDLPHKASITVDEVPNEIPVAPDSLDLDKQSLIWGKPRQPPLGSEEWATFLDSEGRVMDSKALRKRIFYGGVEHNLRREIWAFLLGYHSYDSTYAEREFLRSVKKSEYETIKHQWQSISNEQARRFTKFRERKGLIEKDVVRTDRSLAFYDGDDNPNVNLLRDILLTYSFYNFDLGYCQGMSDLLSPILFVMGDEPEAFWCFVALMGRLGPNFNRDQNGMHSQLFALSKLVEFLDVPLHNYFKQNDCLNYFFCFRWVLIQFKREFEYEKTMRLWEVLWTHHLSEHLHLYVCVAILKRYRNKIMGEQMDFDTLLKFINELSFQIDLDAILKDAEALCLCAGEHGAACIPPGTPPSLPADDGLLYYQQDDEVL